MEVESAKKTPGWENSGPLDPSLSNIDINSLITSMKQGRTWDEGNLNSIVLFRGADRQIVLSVLHEDTEVILNNEVDSVTVHVIEGRMQFHTQDETMVLGKDQLLTLHKKMEYSLTTLETTVFLLTIEISAYRRLKN